MTVLIVGAGVAGLTAAAEIQRQGHHVVVFEQARQPGGRVATRHVLNAEADRPEWSALQFDHGAQYFTARSDQFSRTVEEWHGASVVRRWQGKLAAFDSEGRDPVEDDVARWVGVPGMSSLSRHLARGIDVRFGARVRAVERGRPQAGALGDAAAAGTWTVTLADGTTCPSDALVLAIPAPRAAAMLDGRSGLAAEAAPVAMHACWAVSIAFDARVPAPFDGAFVSSSPLGWIARDRSKPQRGLAETWVLHGSAAWSDAHASDPPDAVGPFLLNAFADLVRGPVPRPIHLHAHCWRFAAADPPLARGALIDRGARLAVCGDWCLGNRVESAYLSGLAAAHRLLEDL